MARRPLSETHPHLRQEFSDRNAPLRFEDLSRGSGKTIWWVCAKGHEWDMKVVTRTGMKCGCPYCAGKRVSTLNSLASRAPHLVAEYHPTKNAKTPDRIAFSSHKYIWWICAKGHEWHMKPNARTNCGHGCPYCSGRRVSDLNSLASRAPHLVAEYHPTKNTKTPDEVAYSDNDKYWWICAKGHEWDAAAGARTGRDPTGCPYCSGRRASELNSLASQAPHLLAEYHPTKNTMAPNEVARSCNDPVWWICAKGHEWKTAPCNRTGGVGHQTGCPRCAPNHTRLERALETLLGVERFSHYIYESKDPLPYKPDVRLSEKLYANADGLYFHNQDPNGKEPRDHRYHFKMRQAFEAKGLRLLQFYEDEVYEKPRIVRSMVNAILGKSPDRTAARKCTVQKVTPDTADRFLDENHIIGKSHACRYWGLYLEDKLVQLITVRLEESTLEIVRSCGKLDTVVVGGFQKLLQHVIREYRPAKVKTLIDLRYADGHSLVKAGFRLEHIAMGYEYTNGKVRQDKRAFRVRRGTSEEPYAASLGWYRIYNAGRARYALDL